jgi:hypothetical protein
MIQLSNVLSTRNAFGAVARTATVFFAVAAAATPARAQESIQNILSFLVTNQAVVTNDFARDQQAAEATRDTLTRALLLELANLPVTSASGGFTYHFNPTLGTVERASSSFGPFFVERGITSGRGQASFGITYQHAQFTRLDGRSLDDGSLVTTANQFSGQSDPFDIDRLTVQLQTDTFSGFATVGLSDRVDVSVAVPVVALRLSGDRVNIYRGESFLQARASANATGLGDIAIRGKFRLFHAGGGSLAASTEVRLPTGNEDNLLGAGRAAFRVDGIVSAENDRLGTHLNAGITRGGLSDQVNYGGALGIAASPRTTLVVELLGHRVTELHRLSSVSIPHPVFPGVETVRLLPGEQSESVLSLAAGFKWNVGGRWLVQANVLVPLTDAGLTSPFMPGVSMDRAFGR